MGTYGHMGILIRTESNGLHINDSVTLEELKFMSDNRRLDECLISLDQVYKLDKITIESRYYDRLVAGNEVDGGLRVKNDEFYVYCRDKLIGMGIKTRDGRIKIDKMLI